MKEKIAEIFKEYRQYLCNTEFAPPPFDDVPVDPDMVNEVFPNKVIDLFNKSDDNNDYCTDCNGEVAVPLCDCPRHKHLRNSIGRVNGS